MLEVHGTVERWFTQRSFVFNSVLFFLSLSSGNTDFKLLIFFLPRSKGCTIIEGQVSFTGIQTLNDSQFYVVCKLDVTGKEGKEGEYVTEGLYDCSVLLNLFPVLLNLSSVYVRRYPSCAQVDYKFFIPSYCACWILYTIQSSVCRMHHE